MDLLRFWGHQLSPHAIFAKLKSQPKLTTTDVKLKTFSGELPRPLGVAHVKVTIDDQSEFLDLFVTEKGTTPLFGRSWLRHLKVDIQEEGSGHHLGCEIGS